MANIALRTRKITWNIYLFIIILHIFCWIFVFIFYECFICISFGWTCQTAWRRRIAWMLNNWRLRILLVIHWSKWHLIRLGFYGLLGALGFSIRSWTNLHNCLIGLFSINTLFSVVNYTRFLLSKILLVRIFLINIECTKLSLWKSFGLLFVKALSCSIEWVISLLLQLVDLG